MRFKRKNIVFLILTVLWMLFIFYMSSKDAVTSSGYSSRVGVTVCEIFIPGFRDKEPFEKAAAVAAIETPIRKCAHFFEFMMLGILAYHAFSSFRVSFIVSVLYAVSDEVHQLFIPGRSCELADMLIDTSGVILSLLIVIGAGRIMKTGKKQKNESFTEQKKP